ncbi:hypothetical protein [Deinococcus soli (ex Cha et al. 2016)]|uniref:Uncharacterized protein n=1 Tax=Deinococcus soli (ex Cha et al. 2016) TaxID=1309411 RepID=A0ACC6KM03_9DEIO|nr:hypothetical protein [Deinococcus soli (ex Cha et al. 2016)]MDR6753436.1 hypothetical protein [Deinococcus soli (ex Cha et al. 2016)]
MPTPKKKDRRSSGAKPQGRPPAYDWTAIRREYIRGDDRVTLESLSSDAEVHQGSQSPRPSLSQLKRRSGAEDWPDLRSQFRAQVAARAQALDLETVEQVRMRQATLGKALQTLAVRAIPHIDLTDVGPHEMARLALVGTQIERQARGMEEYTVRIEDLSSAADLKKLTRDELLELKQRRQKARGAQA